MTGPKILGRSQMKPLSMRFAGLVAAMLVTSGGSQAQEIGERLLEARESLYNNIYVYKNSNLISLTFGYNRRIYTESMYNTLDDFDLPVVYTRFMTAGLVYPKKIERILEIGFGGGRTSWYLHRFLSSVPITSVELDPVVLELARKYFRIRDEENFSVVASDGRTFLKNSNERYDVILVDAYRGPFVPFHLLTKEFYALVKEHLSEGGVLVQNIEPSTMLFDSAVLTINSIFPQIDFFVADGNVVTVAYDRSSPQQDELQKAAVERQQRFKFRYNLADMLLQRRQANLAGDNGPIDKRQGKILTDDFAPVETLKAIEQHNRKWPDP